MKITFFIGSLGGGGAERVISLLANRYAQKGWLVEVALLLDMIQAYELDERIKLADLTCGNGSYYQLIPAWLFKIRRYVKESKPDRIVSFVGRINALVLMACVGLRTPIIVSERNDPMRDGRSRTMLKLCDLAYQRAVVIVYQTKYQASCFSRKLVHKSQVIPNPVSVDAQPAEQTGSTIVTAGRLLPQKNHAMLIDACKILETTHPDISCKIYGNGKLMDVLSDRIRALGLENVVTLCGGVKDIHQRIAEGRVFVMTSEFEGLSNALIEAMMLGLPCITTDYPGADEIIENGRNGLIVPRGDARTLAGEIGRVLENQELRNNLRFEALKTAARYSADKVLGQWEEVIENCENKSKGK